MDFKVIEEELDLGEKKKGKNKKEVEWMHRKLLVQVLKAPAYNSEGQDCPLVCCLYNFISNRVYYT